MAFREIVFDLFRDGILFIYGNPGGEFESGNLREAVLFCGFLKAAREA